MVEVEAERLIGVFVEVQEMTVQNLNLMEVEGVADMSLKFQNFEEAKGERVLKTSEDMAVFVVEVQVERRLIRTWYCVLLLSRALSRWTQRKRWMMQVSR